MPNSLTSRNDRIHFLDNLRSFTIFLVVLVHAGLVYESSGAVAFFWIVDDPSTNHVAGIVNVILDVFVMAALFLVSGYLAAGSLERHGAALFLRSRFRRLMIPWLIAVFTLIPLYKVIFLYSRGLPPESWTTYLHFSNGIYSQNWLWFLPALFLVDLVYALLARLDLAPRRLSLKLAVAAACGIGFVNSFGMDRLGLRGWTKTAVLDFQNERLLLYLMSFLLGALFFHHRVFATRPAGRKLYILAAATSWLPTNVYLVFLLAPFIRPGTILISPVLDRVVVWVSFYGTLLSMLYLLIETFRRYFDGSGPIWRELSRNAYSVYIVHVIVIGGLALALLDSPMPSLWKYLLLTVGSYLVSNLLVSAYRRLRGLGTPRSARAVEPVRLAP